jgi:glyoxylase-like metal-dependent hydrolase (beta-lactamase superfamily II)
VAEAFLKVHPMARFRKAFEDVWKLPWRSVKDRDLLDCGFKVVLTPGHTPGHVVYVAYFGVFTGDHYYPKITPNISWYPIPGFNPSGNIYKALERWHGTQEPSRLTAMRCRTCPIASPSC